MQVFFSSGLHSDVLFNEWVIMGICFTLLDSLQYTDIVEEMGKLVDVF